MHELIARKRELDPDYFHPDPQQTLYLLDHLNEVAQMLLKHGQLLDSSVAHSVFLEAAHAECLEREWTRTPPREEHVANYPLFLEPEEKMMYEMPYGDYVQDPALGEPVPLYPSAPPYASAHVYLDERAHEEELFGRSSGTAYNASWPQPYSPRGPARPKPRMKTHKCPVCLKTFKRPLSFRIHFTTHTGVKQYKCDWVGCGKAFNVKSNMTRHLKLHLRKK